MTIAVPAMHQIELTEGVSFLDDIYWVRAVYRVHQGPVFVGKAESGQRLAVTNRDLRELGGQLGRAAIADLRNQVIDHRAVTLPIDNATPHHFNPVH